MSLFSSSKNEKKQEPKKINIQDLIEDNKTLSENFSLDETPSVSESEVVETPIVLESESVDLDEIPPKGKGISESEVSPENKANDFFEDLKDSTVKSNVVKAPRVFLNWFEKADKNATVFEAYSLVDSEDDPKLKNWVKENQNIFAKIWLGDVIPELELELYMTSIPNYDGKLPNVLVRTEEGKYVIKTSEDILPSDEFRLTEQEILKDWEYLFTNGFSELLD